MNRFEEERYNWIKGIDTHVTKMQTEIDRLNRNAVPREVFDALLEYLKIEWGRVEAHVEFFPKGEGEFTGKIETVKFYPGKTLTPEGISFDYEEARRRMEGKEE